MSKRLRNNRFTMCFSEEEHAVLLQKMNDAGMSNKGEYLRKMALDGYIVRLDLTEARELLRLIANATSNINQIAKRANESRSVYGNDVTALSIEVQKLGEQATAAINIVGQFNIATGENSFQ